MRHISTTHSNTVIFARAELQANTCLRVLQADTCTWAVQEYFELVVSEFVYLPWKETQRLLGHQAAVSQQKKMKLVAPRDSDDEDEDEAAQAMEDDDQQEAPTPALAALTPAAPLNAQVSDARERCECVRAT